MGLFVCSGSGGWQIFVARPPSLPPSLPQPPPLLQRTYQKSVFLFFRFSCCLLVCAALLVSKGGGSSSLNQKSMGAGYHVSGFLSEKVGRLTMTKLQWDAYLSSLDAAGQLRAKLASEFHQAHKPDVGHLDANVSMFIGKGHTSDLHPSGYWTGDDVYKQLDHAITMFEILHPGCKGLFLFDNSTGHAKMADDALLAQGMNAKPGGKLVSKQRKTSWTDSSGVTRTQSFVFKSGDELLFEAKGVRAAPLVHGEVVYDIGADVEIQRPGSRAWRKASVVSQNNGKYTVKICEAESARDVQDPVLANVDVSSIRAPAETYNKGPIDVRLVGHSKGLKQILLERGLIDGTSRLKSKCGTADKKKRKDAKAKEGIGIGESVEVPKHAGVLNGEACCLEYLLSEQPDFKDQQNAIQELVISRGHYCIFLPKYHPELNFIERYWSRVKWHARQYSDGSKEGLRKAADAALSEEACDLALIRRYSRTAWRWVDAYSKGLDGVLAQWAVRKSKKHRCVTDAVDKEVNALVKERERASAARAAAISTEEAPLVLGVLADMTAAGALCENDDGE